jgi:hypothetical protein
MSIKEEELDSEVTAEISRIAAVVASEDPISAIVRGHLYVESLLLQTIAEGLPDPGAIDLARMNFPTKLALTVAMKLVPVEDKRGYAKLNALRNQLSHNFDAVIEERDESALRQSLSESQKKFFTAILAKLKENSAFPQQKFIDLRICVSALCSTSLKTFMSAKHAPKK